jgi:hypothetical protein
MKMRNDPRYFRSYQDESMALPVANILLGDPTSRKRQRSALELPGDMEISRERRVAPSEFAKQMQAKVVTFRYDTGKIDTADPISCVSGIFGYTTIIYDNNNTGTELQNLPWPLAGQYIT